jgi:hypothetical protein
MCPITASMAERRRSSRLMIPTTPRFWPRFVAAVALVDRGARDRAAGESLGAFDHGGERVAVVGISGQSFSVQHELAAGSAGVVVTIEALTPNS